MRRTLLAIAAFVTLALAPSTASAWGFEAHRFITRRAIDLLPSALKPFFEQRREEIVLRVVDPDLWRNVGWPEDPHHFLDFGVKEYGVYPFAELPRDYGAALEKFGRATLERNGLLPWRTAEMFGDLRRTFEALRRQSPYTVSDTILYSAVMSHYVQDAYQPFHATDDYDGVQTGQRGIHSRFERDLFERFQSRLAVNPPPPRPVTSARESSFDTLLTSYQLVPAVLKADKDALVGRDAYDDQYFERFLANVGPLLERRLGEAISATVGFIVGAWEQAGNPVLRLQDVRPLERPR
ncbi:MAG: hypothetical protein A3H97_07455 [Acidobacteria bacterium RIFCSPLOWO2_02_FULL_65_29]|nr:MAG: hypothetical protein A3H97_07455 [Acidobacteria bacterium RIFCSPLOWO2_02_FULL_65_29]